MSLHFLAMAAAVFSCGLFATPADGQIRLFSFPGSDRTGLNGIDDHNNTVGNAIVFPDAYKFTWSVRTNQLTLIEPPPENFHSFGVEGVNNHGVIVGGVGDSETNTTMSFIRQPDGSFSYFAHPDSNYTWATAINEAGLVTGALGNSGFIFNFSTGRFIDFLPSPMTSPNGINRFGKVVGHVFIPIGEDTCGGAPGNQVGYIQYGFVRHQDGFITLFQVNRQDTYAGDIRDDGLVVGAVFDPVVNNDRIFIGRVRKERCVFLTRARSKLIGKIGYQYTPRGISDRGRIVGIATQRVGDEARSYGFVTRVPSE